jgi:2-keto-myo-inositol isomerase
MKYAINQATLMKTPMEDFLSGISQAGFEGVELRRDETFKYLESHTVPELNDLLQKYKIKPITWNAIELFSLCSEAEFHKMLDYTERLMKIGREIGCDTIIAVPSFIEFPGAMKEEEIIKRTVGRFKILRKLANQFSFKLAFEPLGPPNNSVRKLDLAAKILKYAEEDGFPKSGLVVDTFHFFVGENPLESLKEVKDRLWLIHVNDVLSKQLDLVSDSDRVMPGEGSFPLVDFANTLKSIGYDGYISVELFNQDYWEQNFNEVANKAYKTTKAIFS